MGPGFDANLPENVFVDGVGLTETTLDAKILIIQVQPNIQVEIPLEKE